MTRRSLRVIKPEIRVLGIDDGKFTPHSKDQVLVVGVVFRAGLWLEGIMHTALTVDEFDATEKIADMIINSPHHQQLRVILLNGITFAGFNIVDIKNLNLLAHLPVIAVTNKKPNLARVQKALEKLPNSEERWKAVLSAGRIIPVTTRSENQEIYMEIAGILEQTAKEVLKLTSIRSNIPEALRVAHLIASGLTPDCSPKLLRYEKV